MMTEIINFIFFFIGGALIAEIIFLFEKKSASISKMKKIFSKILPSNGNYRCAILAVTGGALCWYISTNNLFKELLSKEVLLCTFLFGTISFLIIEKESREEE